MRENSISTIFSIGKPEVKHYVSELVLQGDRLSFVSDSTLGRSVYFLEKSGADSGKGQVSNLSGVFQVTLTRLCPGSANGGPSAQTWDGIWTRTASSPNNSFTFKVKDNQVISFIYNVQPNLTYVVTDLVVTPDSLCFRATRHRFFNWVGVSLKQPHIAAGLVVAPAGVFGVTADRR